MPDLNIDELERLAKAATPGPWMADDVQERGSDGRWGVWHVASLGPICRVGDPYPRGDNNPSENMDYIAALSPDVALALIARLRKAEEALSRERLEAVGFECFPNVCRSCGHVGGDHSIWNYCQMCDCEHFASMDESERWEYALAKLREEALNARA